MNLRFFCLVPLMLTSFQVDCQYKEDSVSIIQSREKVLTLYERAMEGTHHLYNGSEYIAYEPLEDEHPYFETDEWTFSDLKYDGEWFRNVPLLLDINKGKLITSYYYNGTKMQLVQNRIDEFTLSKHRFINIKESADSTIRKGLYEVLYDGNAQVLAKRVKNIVERIEGTEELRFFKELSQIFVIVDSKPFKINSKREAIKVLKDKRNMLRDYIRKNDLFINDKENSIIQMVKYFDSITQK